MAPRHFLDIIDIDAASLRAILDHAHAMKRDVRAAGPRGRIMSAAEGMALVMIFEKPSTRTRISFDIAMRQLGGWALVLNSSELQLGRGESIEDTARVLSRYGDAVMLRVDTHASLVEFAAHASVPVINGLSNLSHPCQIMADLMTLEEAKGPLGDQRVAWIGDGNNVAVSWIHAALRFGFPLRLACPPELSPDPALLEQVQGEGGDVILLTDPVEAVAGADCVVTDTWVSMGDEDAERRMTLLAPYQVDEALMARAGEGAIFMHCLPAYRGREVTAGVIDGKQSVVFEEAENRLHAQKAILAWCLEIEDC